MFKPSTLCLAAALGGASLVLPASAIQSGSAAEAGRAVAEKACADLNRYGPVGEPDSFEDGLGDWLVWVEDRDGDLWMCNASSGGAVYANAVINGDLLKGHGDALIGRRPAQSVASQSDEPAAKAERLCDAVADIVDDMEAVVTVEDGAGDWLVWLKDREEALWICNASANDELYAFQAVALPINGEAQEEGAGGQLVSVDPRFAPI